jgi:hypothetical protein
MERARWLLGLLLVGEGLASALRFVTRLSVITIYPGITVGFWLARLVVAVQQFTAGSMVLSGRSVGRALAPWTYVQSAALLTLELGVGLASTNIFPAHRSWALAAYWTYALVGVAAFRVRRRL